MSLFSRFQRISDDVIIRPLTLDDRVELETMISSDPVGFLFAAEHLHHFGLPAPSALTSRKTPSGFIGIFVPRNASGKESGYKGAPPAVGGGYGGIEMPLPERLRNTLDTLLGKTSDWVSRSAGAHFSDPAERNLAPMPGLAETLAPGEGPESEPRDCLVGAFWLGANCVPLSLPEPYYETVAHYIWRHNRKIASIFGHRQAVLGIWGHLAGRMPTPFGIRESQPLLELPVDADLTALAEQSLARPRLGAPPIIEPVRWARTDDRPSLLRASIAMFTQEVGYDPMTRDPSGYAHRIDELTRTGRTVVGVNSENIVIFKTDIGLAHGSICQLQGVWLHPAYRGHRLAPTLLAQGAELIRRRFPQLSLYVNDYNSAARALYRSTGWQQTGTFSTVLF
ncbi:GNAT family N-acetyltransferase [Rothia sp. CCM 9416]|uniref:GNAT family N-acetyltransferase n=1 Tax=Rothia sp. CCM 9416 TaxID=3402655 RepID=UPI003ADF58D8